MFLQVDDVSVIRQTVADRLQAAAQRLHSVGLAQLSVRARSGGAFDKVKDLIKTMIERLEKKHAEEAEKQGYCVKETKETNDKRSKVSTRVDLLASRLEKAESNQKSQEDRASKEANKIRKLQDGVRQATKQRASEKAAFEKERAETKESIDQLSKGRSTLEGQFAPDHMVFGILDELMSRSQKALSEIEATESNAASKFESLVQDSEVDAASMKAKQQAADEEAHRMKTTIADVSDDLKEKRSELAAVDEYARTVAAKCTRKAPTYEERAAKRQEEIQSLKDAQDLLG